MTYRYHYVPECRGPDCIKFARLTQHARQILKMSGKGVLAHLPKCPATAKLEK